mmetsp:Transcript_25777/g.56498  ORF Transcript_25777/g.56498 Transcript_25777/m.56498 type:complete len:322 (-) Transcript_25777:387-1352(-)
MALLLAHHRQGLSHVLPGATHGDGGRAGLILRRPQRDHGFLLPLPRSHRLCHRRRYWLPFLHQGLGAGRRELALQHQRVRGLRHTGHHRRRHHHDHLHRRHAQPDPAPEQACAGRAAASRERHPPQVRRPPDRPVLHRTLLLAAAQSDGVGNVRRVPLHPQHLHLQDQLAANCGIRAVELRALLPRCLHSLAALDDLLWQEVGDVWLGRGRDRGLVESLSLAANHGQLPRELHGRGLHRFHRVLPGRAHVLNVLLHRRRHAQRRSRRIGRDAYRRSQRGRPLRIPEHRRQGWSRHRQLHHQLRPAAGRLPHVSDARTRQLG